MADSLKRYAGPIVAALLILAIGGAMLVGWQRYNRDYVVSVEDDGSAVTKIIAERISGSASLRVSQLNGTIQSTARDVRGFGWLKSDQVVKMPFSVDYFVDLSGLSADDLEWNEQRRTLIVNAPDVTAGKPNLDEARRTLVRTSVRRASSRLGLPAVTSGALTIRVRRCSFHSRSSADSPDRSTK